MENTLIISATLMATLLLWAPRLPAQVAAGQEMVMLSPSERVHELTLNSQVATTVTFPADVTLMTGYGLVQDANAAASFIEAEKLAAASNLQSPVKAVTIVHCERAANDTLVMRAVRPGVPCYVTVRCTNKVFLFKLVAGDQANLAVVVGDPGEINTTREVTKEEIVKSRIAYNSTELLGLLGKAKQREFLQTVNPGLYEGWRMRRDLHLVSEDGELRTIIKEIHQCSKKDALVFRCTVENQTDKSVRFKPSDVKIRAGDRTYPAQLVDTSGAVNPRGRAALDIVVQGNPEGSKEYLSIENDFRVEAPADHSAVINSEQLIAPNPLLPHLEAANQPLPSTEAVMASPTTGK